MATLSCQIRQGGWTAALADDLQFVAVPSMAAPPRDLPLRSCRARWLPWVGTRRATLLVRRRKPASQVSHPESCRTPSSAADPLQPVMSSTIARQVSRHTCHPTRYFTDIISIRPDFQIPQPFPQEPQSPALDELNPSVYVGLDEINLMPMWKQRRTCSC